MKKILLVAAPLVTVTAYLLHLSSGDASSGIDLLYPYHTRVVYAIDWRSEAATVMPKQSTSGANADAARSVGALLGFKGELALRRVESTLSTPTDGVRLCAAFAQVEEVQAKVFEQNVFAGTDAARQQLAGREACFDLDERGRIVRFAFPVDAHVTFMQFMQGALESAQFTHAAANERSWFGQETSTLGVANSDYTRVDEAPTTHIRRSRNSFAAFTGLPPWARDGAVEVQGSGELTLDAQAGAKYIASSDSVAVADAAGSETYALKQQLSLNRLRVEPDTSGPETSGRIREVRVGQAIGLEEARMAAQQKAASKTSIAAIQSTLHGYAGGQLPVDQLASIVAFLKLNPDACEPIGRLLQASSLDATQKALAIDLLVGAGTPAAQAALRNAFAAGAFDGDPKLRISALQRFVMLKDPEVASAQLLLGEIDRNASVGNISATHAALVSLGAVAGRLDGVAGAAASTQALNRIQKFVDEATTPQARAAAIVALGNTRDAAQVDRIAGFSQDKATAVRTGAALALGSIESPAATSQLLAMARDHDGNVASLALRSLQERELAPTQLREFESLISSGTTNSEADQALIAAIARQADADPDAVRRMLTSVLNRHEASDDVAIAVRRILNALDQAQVNRS
jgi:hypothetical protein